jgi:poly-gamma-glutamate synthase PgsB/CapB
MGALEVASVLAAGGYFAFLLGESWWLKRARKTLRIVVHVNGTRGKTETTRLIAAALRAGGIRTLAKTTGTEPRMLLEDGSEQPWRRWGAANVREQRDFLRVAVRRKAEAIVVECMAVSPDAQAASTAFLQPNVLVVTNSRPDHAAELGTPEDALVVFAEGIPTEGAVITADASIHPELAQRAAARGAQCLLATPFDAGLLCHAENAGAALAVAEYLGIPRETAILGMRAHTPDAGAFALRRLPRRQGGFILIVDALSANDPLSTDLLFQRAGITEGRRVLLLVNRADRPDRAHVFARWASAQPAGWDAILLAGDSVPGVRRLLAGQENLRRLRKLEDLADEPEGTTVFATGNWKLLGPALAILAPAMPTLEGTP